MKSDDPALRPKPLLRLANALSPGSSISGIENLPGGLDAAMCAFELLHADGSRSSLVLRRYIREPSKLDPQAAMRCWHTLSILESLQFPAPRPVWLDQAGDIFGCPALVMSRVTGQANLNPVNVSAWIRELAGSLAKLHALHVVESGGSNVLPGPGESLRCLLENEGSLAARVEAHPQAQTIIDILRSWQAKHRVDAPVLVHGDYWAGNTIWAGSAASAIVDWDSAAYDEPGMDVGYCRMDLAMLMGVDAPDCFLKAYEHAAGRAVPFLGLWDLAACLRALPDPARWLPGYHGLGRLDVTAEAMRGGLYSFMSQALYRAAQELHST